MKMNFLSKVSVVKVEVLLMLSIADNNGETQLCGLILLQNMSVSFQA